MHPKVLIIDDEILNIEILTDILENENMIVYSAENANDAMILYRKKKPDIIILDLNIPVVSGKSFLAKNIKHLDMSIIIIVSGFISKEDYNNFKKIGIQYFFYKPIDYLSLIGTIKKMILPQKNKQKRRYDGQ